MQKGQPSRTAMGAAARRAAHQVLDGGAIFCDPLALTILGWDRTTALRESKNDRYSRALRLFIAARSRIAEDALAAAAARGTTQLVVLGAGLDTYACRATLPGLRVFEVDHPATQAWKRDRLASAAIPVPPSLVFAPVDFERQSLAHGLAAAGFDPAQDSFFTWLGVVPYLVEETIVRTLCFIAGLAGDTCVIFDYANPPGQGGPLAEIGHRLLAARVALAGEPFRSYFETAQLHAQLRALGLAQIEDLGPREISARFIGARGAPRADRGGHIVIAAR
jgi:methyltransferase (TIGR00027 family)